MKQIVCLILAVFSLSFTAFADMPEESGVSVGEPEHASAFDIDEQLDALGRDELMRQIPDEARELMRQTDTYELSVGRLLNLSPRDFFRTIWGLLLNKLEKPIRTFAAIVGIIVLCALAGGLRTGSDRNSLSQVFTMIAALCILTSVIAPILDCVVDTSKSVQDAALFMLSYIPVFSASLAASGSPITGAAYNMFLFSACQIVSQIVAGTLIPLMGIYLSLCIVGSLVPEIKIKSACAGLKSIISWSLGFILTIFVGLLSLQTMVSQSADTVAAKTTKFMIGSFVPIVGGALSEAYTAAQGCLKLLKTTLGAYGVLAAVFIFLPPLLQTIAWYLLTNLAVIAGDILGVPAASAILKSCASALGILIAIMFCFALLIIVSTTVVMVTGMGAA